MKPTVWSGAAGLAGPIWFTILVIIQSILQPDYSQVALPISALAAWPLGWMQQLNFVVFSILMGAFAIGLHRGIHRSRGAWVSLLLLLLPSVGLMIAGLSSWQRGVANEFIVPIAHRAGAVMTFLGSSLGFIAMSRRMARDQRWKDLTAYVLGSGIVMLVLFVATTTLVVREAAPFDHLAGLFQRATLVVWFPCLMVISRRLMRVASPAIDQK